MGDVESHLSAEELADLAALADGSLRGERRAEVDLDEDRMDKPGLPQIASAERIALQNALVEPDARQVRAVEDDIDRAFNDVWGPMFREGYEVSKFGEQVEAYACVYTSRVSNFRFYSPMQYFRGPRDRMPHER